MRAVLTETFGSRLGRAPMLVAVGVAVAVSGSGVNPAAGPDMGEVGAGEIRVITSTGGQRLDPDGYEVRLTDAAPRAAGVNDTLLLTGLPAGDHAVELRRVADNCLPAPSPTASVTVEPGRTKEVFYRVSCVRGPLAFVAVAESFRVDVIDTETHTKIQEIPTPTQPRSVAFSPDGAHAYVGLEGRQSGGGVLIIDRRNASTVGRIDAGRTLIRNLAISGDGTRLYAVDFVRRELIVIDTNTNRILTRIGDAGNEDLVLAPGERLAYVSDVSGVKVVDTSTNTVIDTVELESAAEGITITPDGRFVYVARPGEVSVIETAAGGVVRTIHTARGDSALAGGAADIIATPDGTTVYRSSTCCAVVSAISTATNAVTANIEVELAPSGLALTPDGAFLYVANSYSGTVSVIETATNTVVADSVATGSFPMNVTIENIEMQDAQGRRALHITGPLAAHPRARARAHPPSRCSGERRQRPGRCTTAEFPRRGKGCGDGRGGSVRACLASSSGPGVRGTPKL